MKPSRNRRATLLAAATLAALPVATIWAADAPTGGEPRVRSFVLSNVYIASSGDAGSCPALSDGGLEIFAKTLPPGEQAKYAAPDKRPALGKLMGEKLGFRRLWLGGKSPIKLPPGFDPATPPTPEQALEIGAINGFPKGRGRLAFSNRNVVYSSCSNPEDFPQLAKGHRVYDGKVAPGMDLDGKTGREDFVGLDGTKGVDNQLWRAVGCLKPFRESGESASARKTFISALAPTLIEIRDIDDARNDPDVTVHVYAGLDKVTRDGRGGALAGATFTASPDPRLHATARGRIVDGVLLTEPVDISMNYKEQIIDAPREIRDARIRAVLKLDGGIEGSINGYYTLASYWSSIEQMTQNGADVSSISCPGIRQAIDRYADGYRDPKTGRFTAISSSYNFFGVRAFVAKPNQTAAAGAIR